MPKPAHTADPGDRVVVLATHETGQVVYIDLVTNKAHVNLDRGPSVGLNPGEYKLTSR